MKEYQARGYIFESIIWDVLLNNGYTNPEPERTIRGRGAWHQIDAYGYLTYPIPFVYPIRLLSEAKCYKKGKKVDLPAVRNFVGVIKDVSEYYIVNDDRTHDSKRFTDVGCIFSSSPFTEDAQNYAWAHNIKLVPFTTNEFQEIKQAIDEYVESIKSNLGNLEIEQLKGDFKNSQQYASVKNNLPTFTFGIIDEFYPIVLISQKRWLTDDKIPPDTDVIHGIKISRKNFEDIDLGVRFNLNISNTDVFFTLPHYVAWKIITKIEERYKNQDVFELNIPVLYKPNPHITDPSDAVRRILRVKIDIEEPNLLSAQKEKIKLKLKKEDMSKNKVPIS
jgi:hypothetical protein